MFGLLDDIADGIGTVVGTVVGVPVATAAIALGFSSEVVKAAITAGCETVEEIKNFIENI